jgi:hypothetical protein
MYALLQSSQTDVIIWTDVKDVIFQKDPTEWLNKWMRRDILAFSECIKLSDDPWAVVNSGTTFPMEWEFGMKDQISYCAGTIVGKREAMRDLFIDIYRWSKTTANPEQLSDQAAFNVLLRLDHYKHSVDFVDQERGFATQLGTVWVNKDKLPITEPTPIYKDNNRFYNQRGDAPRVLLPCERVHWELPYEKILHCSPWRVGRRSGFTACRASRAPWRRRPGGWSVGR